ncbi:hypothetical protein JW824_11075 [bacterium]|nr:hypothetical protein [bacterium]
MMREKKKYLHHRQQICLCLILILFLSLNRHLIAQAEDPDPERFSEEIDAFIQWDLKNSFPEHAVLFVGSSSIRLWPTAVSFPELDVINRGFGGSHISDVNHYYEQIVRKYKPSEIIFYAGDNDIAAEKSPDQVFEDFQYFVERVEMDMPETCVFYLPIKPSLSRWHLWSEMQETNLRIKQYTEEKPQLFYVDTALPMLDQRGEPNPELFLDDGLHLNDQGYQMWNKVLSFYLN